MHSLSACVQPAYHAVSDEYCSISVDILIICNLKTLEFQIVHMLCQEVGNGQSYLSLLVSSFVLFFFFFFAVCSLCMLKAIKTGGEKAWERG